MATRRKIPGQAWIIFGLTVLSVAFAAIAAILGAFMVNDTFNPFLR